MRLAVKLDGPDRAASVHKGLALDRFVPPKTEKPEVKRAALDAVVKITSCYDAYKLAYCRWKAMLESRQLPLFFEGRVRGRMALGLGIESVHEIGCRLHHTYGVPVIPGSTLKGLLAASLRTRPEYHDAATMLFGGPENHGYAQVLDAWWVPEGNKSGLAVDVIAVHHQNYYSGKAAPVDTESPIPVHFLSVTGKFLFAFDTPDKSWREFLEKLAKDVLSTEGIGAKRSSGYGRFTF